MSGSVSIYILTSDEKYRMIFDNDARESALMGKSYWPSV